MQSSLNSLLPSEVIWFRVLLDGGNIRKKVEVNSVISDLLHFKIWCYMSSACKESL